jgi:recombinational DNA repair protein RecR
VVERNIDAEVMLKKASWTGLIFVLGGQFQVIEKRNASNIHLEGLITFIKKHTGELKEIILCNSLNPDGVFTASVLHQKINELVESEKLNKIKITTFGRGFSTGTELEYADKETLENALKNRSENI